MVAPGDARARDASADPVPGNLLSRGLRLCLPCHKLDAGASGVGLHHARPHPLSEKVSRSLLEGGWIGLFYAAYLLKRFPQCLTAPLYNCVVVRRELLQFNDYGDLFLERLLLALNRNVVLDFDDDIGAAKREPRPLSTFGRLLRENPTKFGDSLRLYPRLFRERLSA